MSTTDIIPCDLTPHPNRYASLSTIDDECPYHTYDDLMSSSLSYATYDIISPTSTSSSISTTTTTSPSTIAPFWYGNEDTSHIQHIISYYTHALHLKLPHERIHGERSPLIYIGRIQRHVIPSSHHIWRTYDIITTYTRDIVPMGYNMNIYQCNIGVRTIWNDDGIPIKITKLSTNGMKHYQHHIDTTYDISILNITPIYGYDNHNFIYSHVDNNDINNNHDMMTYAHRDAQIIAKTNRLINKICTSTSLVRSGSDECLVKTSTSTDTSTSIDDEYDDMTYIICDDDHDDINDDDELSDGSDTEEEEDDDDDDEDIRYDEMLRELHITPNINNNNNKHSPIPSICKSISTDKLSSVSQSSSQKQPSQSQSQPQQQAQKQISYPSFDIDDDDCGFIIARDGYKHTECDDDDDDEGTTDEEEEEEEEEEEDEVEVDEEEDHDIPSPISPTIPIHHQQTKKSSHHTHPHTQTQTPCLPTFQTDFETLKLFSGLYPMDRTTTHPSTTCQAGW